MVRFFREETFIKHYLASGSGAGAVTVGGFLPHESLHGEEDTSFTVTSRERKRDRNWGIFSHFLEGIYALHI